MRRKPQEDLESSQESLSYVPDDILKNRMDVADRADYFDKFYPHMFIEDVKLSIVPIGGRVSKKEFNISLEPSDQKVQQIIEKALSPDRYHHDLAGTICDFIADCAVRLLVYEKVVYEIVYLSESENRKTVGFELVQINPYTLVHRGNSVCQFLPEEHSKKLRERRCLELRPDRILTFRLPMNVQGKLDHMMESMRTLNLTSPDFFMKELAAGLKKTPYDVAEHHHLKNVALAKTTKDFGWNARNSFEKEASEYYLIYRHLKFERFKIELRNKIVDTLNAGIELAGKQLDFDNKISINGLPTLDTVETAFNHLQQGDVPFGEVLEPFQGF